MSTSVYAGALVVSAAAVTGEESIAAITVGSLQPPAVLCCRRWAGGVDTAATETVAAVSDRRAVMTAVVARDRR